MGIFEKMFKPASPEQIDRLKDTERRFAEALDKHTKAKESYLALPETLAREERERQEPEREKSE